MKNSVKNFFEDYVETQAVCTEFYKKHWKGQIILSVSMGLVTFGVLAIPAIIKQKKAEKEWFDYLYNNDVDSDEES